MARVTVASIVVGEIGSAAGGLAKLASAGRTARTQTTNKGCSLGLTVNSGGLCAFTIALIGIILS